MFNEKEQEEVSEVHKLRIHMMKSLLCTAILLFAAISIASATGINIDTAHHHLGDDFKNGLTPSEPEGLVYTATFNLDSPTDIRSAELTLTAKSVVPGPTDEFLDKVYLNDKELGALNNHIPAETPEGTALDVAFPIDPIILYPGTNTIKITSGSNADGSNYDDFEFSNLGIRITKTEPVTIEPPLKVAWTHELSHPYLDPSWMPPISVIADGAIYRGKGGIKAIDANTGIIRWDNDLDADPWGNDWDLGYNDGILYALNSPNSPNIYALDAKTGKVLWSKEYTNIGGTPVILGNTLYAATPYDRYVFAINTANGTLEWQYELNLTEFGTGGRNYYSISSPAVSADIVVFQFRATHSSYTGPPVAIEPGEPEPELGKTITKDGLIALDTNTGEEAWQYTYAGEIPFSKPFIYKDIVYTILDYGVIIALSIETGGEVWQAEIGDWAVIAAVEEGKLFVDSNKPPLILNADTGEIFNEYPDSKLSFSSAAITDGFIYSTSWNKIQVFDSNTGELVWTGDAIKGHDGSAPTLYKDRLYLTSTDGKLYAFEHGKEPFAIKTIHIYLATLAILFMLCAIAYKKGFISKLRIKNKVINGIIIGAVPFIIIAISLLYILIVEDFYHSGVGEGIALSLGMGFVFSLIAAVIAGILGGVLGYVSRKE